MHPDRVVLGSDDPKAREIAANVYRPILEQQIPGDVGKRDVVPLLQTKLTTAEMVKYASNAFLATKISFANEIARLCDFVGADITEVTAGMGLDTRIGGRFLDAGLGWGGSCFGKDLSALINTANEYGYQPKILEGAVSVNESQRKHVVDQLLGHLKTLRGAKICILGLSFKPHTDDLRDSPALDVATRLIGKGAFVAAYDPMVTAVPDVPDIRLMPDAIRAAANADAIVLATDWPQFLSVRLTELRRSMRGDLFFDSRNNFDPVLVEQAGFRYVGIGRGGATTPPGSSPIERCRALRPKRSARDDGRHLRPPAIPDQRRPRPRRSFMALTRTETELSDLATGCARPDERGSQRGHPALQRRREHRLRSAGGARCPAYAPPASSS